MSVRSHLLRLLGQLVEPMTDAELARVVIAAGGIGIMGEVSQVMTAGLAQLEEEGRRPYFWDRITDTD